MEDVVESNADSNDVFLISPNRKSGGRLLGLTNSAAR